jgi:hypothetical protein
LNVGNRSFGGIEMPELPISLRLKLPFLIAGFASFLFSVWLYFVQEQEMAGIFVGLWVPSIHSLGTLLVAQVELPNQPQNEAAQS